MIDEPGRRTWRDLLLGTRLGRAVLFAGAAALAIGILTQIWKGPRKGTSGREETSSALKETTTSRKEDLPPRPTGFDESLPVAQQYKALVSSYGERVTSTEKELDKTRQELGALKARIEESRQARKSPQASPGGLAGDVKEAVETALAKPLREEARSASGPGSPAPQEAPAGSAAGGLRILELEPPKSPDKPPPRRAVHVTAATGGEATLLNGVFAPVSGEPSPVRLRFDAALIGPNRSRIPIRDAFLIGKAQGDANSCRVTVQVEKLAFVKPGGGTVESKVLGYVVGKDGLEGVPGSYEWRALEVLPLAGVASGVSAGTDALAQGQATTSITPLGGAIGLVTGDPLKFAGYRAASGLSGKMGEIIVERMREIRPAVSTPAGGKVEVVFLEGVTLENLDVEEIDHGRDAAPFAGLDLHR